MKTTRIISVNDRRKQDELWNFYEAIFDPLDGESPIRQSFPRSDFYKLLKDRSVIKIISRDDKGVLGGLGLITKKIEVETFFSTKFFERKYPGIPLYYIIAIAVRSDLRNSRLAFNFLNTMLREIPLNGRGIFMHSMSANHAIARFGEIASKGQFEGEILDQEAISIYKWKERLDIAV